MVRGLLHPDGSAADKPTVDRAVVLQGARRPRVLALPRIAAWQALTAIVALSTLVRTLVAFRRETPMYFPDEYMYSELGRSIATSGRPLVRGAESTFPSLLQPIVTAPAWLLDDVATAYHLIQAGNALAMSLAAVPVYLLARRIGVDSRLALAAAAVSLMLPDLLYTGWMLSEPFAYPLALFAALAGVRALERPSARTQLAFLAVAGVASFARAQLLVLPLCFIVAAIIVEARQWRLTAVRRHWLVGTAVGLATAGFFLRGGSVGLYRDVLSLDLTPATVADRLALQSLSLLYACGWVIVPGAALGVALAVVRPRSRAELAFGAFAASLVVSALLQAALWGDSSQMQERYMFYAVPLLAVAFALHAQHGWPWRRAHALGCAAMLLVAATAPLSGYAVQAGKQHATFLFAVTRAEELLGGIGPGALAVGAAAGALSLATAALAWSRMATIGVTALALAACAASAGLAASYDLRYDAAVRRDYLPADRSWVDHAVAGDVALLYGRGQPKEGLEQLFWNRSVNRVLLMPGAPPLDAFGAQNVAIGRDGTLLEGGRPLHQPLLVDEGAAVIELRGARRIAASQAYALWRPAGVPALTRYFTGWYRDGWLANSGVFRVWSPRVSGRIRFTVRRDVGDEPATLWILTPAGRRSIRVEPGTARTVELTACGTRLWQASFSVDHLTVSAERLLGMRATRPVWTEDPRAC
jgi:hypothetical protein